MNTERLVIFLENTIECFFLWAWSFRIFGLIERLWIYSEILCNITEWFGSDQNRSSSIERIFLFPWIANAPFTFASMMIGDHVPRKFPILKYAHKKCCRYKYIGWPRWFKYYKMKWYLKNEIIFGEIATKERNEMMKGSIMRKTY